MQPKWGEVKNEEKAGGVCFSCECFVEPTASGCADSVVLLGSDGAATVQQASFLEKLQLTVKRVHAYMDTAHPL